MTFKWSDYLHLSEELLHRRCDNIEDEALYRCIISRSYYSLLIQARNRLKEQGEEIYDTHREVPEVLRSRSNPKAKSIAADLDKLRAGRRKADYDDNFHGNVQSDAQNYVKWARRSMHALQAL